MLLVSLSWSLLPVLAAAGAAGIVVLVLVAGGVVDGVVDDSPWEIDHHVSMSHRMFRYRLTASQISSPSHGPSEPFLMASHGSGYHGLAWLGLARLAASGRAFHITKDTMMQIQAQKHTFHSSKHNI